MNEHEERLAQVREKLDAWQIGGLLITSAANRRWLSGFTGSAGSLLVTRDHAILATDSRYWEQMRRQSPHFTLFEDKRRPEDTAAFIHAAGVTEIGLEAQHVTLHEAQQLREIDDVSWIELEETLEPLRVVKSTAEMEQIRAAAAITDAVMAQVNALARVGMTERELAWELEKRLREGGAEATAFTIIVASGPNSALPHHRPGDRRLAPGEPLIVDMGAQLNGYMSDLTRTFHLGSRPDEQFWSIYNLVLAAQTAVLEQAQAGMTGRAIDAIGRGVINDAGHGEHFGHGLGHGVGLEIHERPSLSSRRGDEVVPAGAVITVEPGVYISGWGGVRIEDLLQVTAEGTIPLSRCPKDPLISH